MGELQVEKHLVAIRRFLFMQDGEFGQSLSDQLFEKVYPLDIDWNAFQQ